MFEYWGSESEWVVAGGFDAHQASKHCPKVIWAMIISMCTAWMPGVGPDLEESHSFFFFFQGEQGTWDVLGPRGHRDPAATFGASLEGISLGDGL